MVHSMSVEVVGEGVVVVFVGVVGQFVLEVVVIELASSPFQDAVDSMAHVNSRIVFIHSVNILQPHPHNTLPSHNYPSNIYTIEPHIVMLQGLYCQRLVAGKGDE